MAKGPRQKVYGGHKADTHQAFVKPAVAPLQTIADATSTAAIWRDGCIEPEAVIESWFNRSTSLDEELRCTALPREAPVRRDDTDRYACAQDEVRAIVSSSLASKQSTPRIRPPADLASSLCQARIDLPPPAGCTIAPDLPCLTASERRLNHSVSRVHVRVCLCCVPACRNWQTSRTQNAVSARA